jgi:hypothetical protein
MASVTTARETDLRGIKTPVIHLSGHQQPSTTDFKPIYSFPQTQASSIQHVFSRRKGKHNPCPCRVPRWRGEQQGHRELEPDAQDTHPGLLCLQIYCQVRWHVDSFFYPTPLMLTSHEQAALTASSTFKPTKSTSSNRRVQTVKTSP